MQIPSMEEAWNDLNPPPSQNPNRNPTPNHGLTLQDFLNPNPAGKGGYQAYPATTTTPATSNQPCRLACASAVPYFSSFLKDLNYSPFDHAVASSSSPCTTSSLFNDPFSLNKRSHENDCPIGDRRFKRMMKNRESAARSRSRRMAYVFELERKKSRLKEENASLKRQLQQHQLVSAAAAAAEEAPKRRNLSRSFSALF